MMPAKTSLGRLHKCLYSVCTNASLGTTWHYWTSLGIIWHYWISLGTTWHYWTPHGTTRRWAAPTCQLDWLVRPVQQAGSEVVHQGAIVEAQASARDHHVGSVAGRRGRQVGAGRLGNRLQQPLPGKGYLSRMARL